MSKVDAMRALREARRAAAAKGVPAAAPSPAPRASTQARPAARRAPAAETAEPSTALCGHRNMGGRSCTREADHVQNGTRNHRYG